MLTRKSILEGIEAQTKRIKEIRESGLQDDELLAYGSQTLFFFINIFEWFCVERGIRKDFGADIFENIKYAIFDLLSFKSEYEKKRFLDILSMGLEIASEFMKKEENL